MASCLRLQQPKRQLKTVQSEAVGLSGRQLTTLELQHCTVKEPFLKGISQLASLQYLDLSYCKGVSKPIVSELWEMRGLTDLQISGYPLNDNDLPHLKGLTNLRLLAFEGPSLTDDSLAQFFNGFDSLREVQVCSSQYYGIVLHEQHLLGFPPRFISRPPSPNTYTHPHPYPQRKTFTTAPVMPITTSPLQRSLSANFPAHSAERQDG